MLLFYTYNVEIVRSLQYRYKESLLYFENGVGAAKKLFVVGNLNLKFIKIDGEKKILETYPTPYPTPTHLFLSFCFYIFSGMFLLLLLVDKYFLYHSKHLGLEIIHFNIFYTYFFT